MKVDVSRDEVGGDCCRNIVRFDLPCLRRTRTPEIGMSCPAEVLALSEYWNELMRGYRDKGTHLGFEHSLKTCEPYGRTVESISGGSYGPSRGGENMKRKTGGTRS